jgi:hypothetical protein
MARWQATPEASSSWRDLPTEGGMTELDLCRLLKLRLAVAGYGEMDVAGWWNTRGMLGRNGALVLSRGFPRTHLFAQARVVFAVARARCLELFDPPDSITLWKLPANVESQFEDRWHEWLAESDGWTDLFEQIAAIEPTTNLLEVLSDLTLVNPPQRESVSVLPREASGRAVKVPGNSTLTDEAVTLLGAGFARGEQGAPAVPYAPLPNPT